LISVLCEQDIKKLFPESSRLITVVGPNSFGQPITNGDKDVTMSYDALRRGRHPLHQQVYCITAVTRHRHPLFTVITAASLLVRELRHRHEQVMLLSLPGLSCLIICTG